MDVITALRDFFLTHQRFILNVTGGLAALATAIYVVSLSLRFIAWLLKGAQAAARAAIEAFFNLFRVSRAVHWTAPPSPDRRAPVKGAFRATHFVYLCLFVSGVITTARVLIALVPDHAPLEGFFIFPMLAFAVTNCVHQYLIYRDLLHAEDPQSEFFIRYHGWWMGSAAEVAMRIVAMTCLLVIAGEIPLDDWLANRMPADLGDEHLVVLSANCLLYATFLTWNLIARVRIIRLVGMSDEDLSSAKKELKQSTYSDGLALVMWICAILAVALNQQLFVLGISTFVLVYLANILWFRVRSPQQQRPKDRLYRILFATFSLAVLVILDHHKLHDAISAAIPQNVKNAVPGNQNAPR